MILLAIPVSIASVIVMVSIITLFFKELRRFKEKFVKKPPRITELPIITATGQIVNTVEELDLHLDFLKNQLEEKENELETAKSKISSTEESLKRLTDTANEVGKYYMKLKAEIAKNENECRELQSQIDEYHTRQIRLRDEVNENVKYYTELLGDIENTESNTDCTKDYEVTAPTSSQNIPESYET